MDGPPPPPPDDGDFAPTTYERIALALERIAAAIDAIDDRDSYNSALARWSAGQGRHPDD